MLYQGQTYTFEIIGGGDAYVVYQFSLPSFLTDSTGCRSMYIAGRFEPLPLNTPAEDTVVLQVEAAA
jgi:hypothetical protein